MKLPTKGRRRRLIAVTRSSGPGRSVRRTLMRSAILPGVWARVTQKAMA